MKTTSFHISNFGSFSGNIPTDQNGYAHTTQAAWMKAPMDWASEDDRAYRLDRCAELAKQTRDEVKKSEAALAEWQTK